MAKINLLYVITKLELGGAQKQLLNLINNLNEQAYNIFLFTAYEGLLIPEALAIDKLVVKRSRFLERPINPLKDILALREVYNFIKNNKIQIVHTHSSKAGILGRVAAKLAGVEKIIHTVHGWSFHDAQPKITYNFYLFLEKICAGFTDRIIVVSDRDKNKGLKNLIGKEGQYSLIRYSIDHHKFKDKPRRNAIRREWGVKDTDLAIGMVACFKPQKSPLDFVRLAALINNNFPDVKFILAGDGILRKKICVLIKKLKLEDKIILTGWSKDIPGILCGLDVFVLTSLWEGLPIAALEAMAAGVALVVTDTGGVNEIVRDGKTGYLVKSGDLQSMQNRVEELLRNTQQRTEFASLAQSAVAGEDFLLDNLVKNTEKIYLNS